MKDHLPGDRTTVGGRSTISRSTGEPRGCTARWKASDGDVAAAAAPAAAAAAAAADDDRGAVDEPTVRRYDRDSSDEGESAADREVPAGDDGRVDAELSASSVVVPAVTSEWRRNQAWPRDVAGEPAPPPVTPPVDSAAKGSAGGPPELAPAPSATDTDREKAGLPSSPSTSARIGTVCPSGSHETWSHAAMVKPTVCTGSEKGVEPTTRPGTGPAGATGAGDGGSSEM
mmetsp:Transcript_5936/g.19377  ORF Transcript_5936/g.19377 Transcript_5936/m.19377 type:complete len:229 (+) Transcript_5936:2458-3144(+)